MFPVAGSPSSLRAQAPGSNTSAVLHFQVQSAPFNLKDQIETGEAASESSSTHFPLGLSSSSLDTEYAINQNKCGSIAQALAGRRSDLLEFVSDVG